MVEMVFLLIYEVLIYIGEVAEVVLDIMLFLAKEG
jgi:hypothetical protein